MYIPAIEEVFMYDGERLLCREESRKMWPCQRCYFYERCTKEAYENTLPPCRAEHRPDNKNVVYQLYIPQRRHRGGRYSK